MTERRYMFPCTGNSARSAECVLRREGGARFETYGAGSRGEPCALDLLGNRNFPVDRLRSRDREEFAAPGAPDFVFTVCDNAAKETCPVWPEQPMSAHWGIPGPAAVAGAVRRAAFADSMRLHRISIFVNLPMEGLDRLSPQKRLDEIGAARPAPRPLRRTFTGPCIRFPAPALPDRTC